MGSFKIELNTRKLEQAIKKQQQEAKRLAERQAREAKIQTAKSEQRFNQLQEIKADKYAKNIINRKKELKC